MLLKQPLLRLVAALCEKVTRGGVVMHPGLQLRIGGSGTFDGVYYVEKVGREDSGGGAYRRAFVLVRSTGEEP